MKPKRSQAPASQEAKFTFEIEDGHAIITGLANDFAGDLVIPSTIDGYPVTEIGKGAFEDYTELTSVVIPQGVVKVGERAFFHCTVLASVSFPKSIKEIGHSAFWICSALTTAVIPKGVRIINDCMFGGGSALISIVIPEEVKKIMGAAFAGCTSLTSVLIPRSVTEIEDGAFSGCISLKIEVDTENPTYCARDGVLFDKSMQTLLSAAGVAGEYSVPKCVTSIRHNAFGNNKTLRSIILPEGVKELEDLAFWGCSALTSVSLPESVTRIGHGAFENYSALISIVIPANIREIDFNAFAYCVSLRSIRFEGIPPKIRGEWKFELPSVGYYPATFRKKWEAKLDKKGHWHGLPMKCEA